MILVEFYRRKVIVMAAKEIKYTVVKELGNLSEDGKKNIKKVCLMKWGEAKEPKFDIRQWFKNEAGEEVPGKGITLSDDEAGILLEILQNNY